MWFNNVVVYKFANLFEKSSAEIMTALEEHRLKPCPAHARQSQGWVNPFNNSTEKLYSTADCHVLVAAKEVRLLPASIITAVLEEKLAAFELEHQRPMRRAEILQSKEEIEFELLPKAFTVTKKSWLYIDTINQWIVINAANSNAAAEIISLATKALGSLTAMPLTLDEGTDGGLSSAFSSWLSNPLSLPDGLVIQSQCVLINSKNDKSQYNCKDIEQNITEILALLAQGYSVTSLDLVYLDRIQFTLSDNLIIKRLKCIDYLEDALKDNANLEDAQAKFDANFSLMVGELRTLINFLSKLSDKKDGVHQHIAESVVDMV